MVLLYKSRSLSNCSAVSLEELREGAIFLNVLFRPKLLLLKLGTEETLPILKCWDPRGIVAGRARTKMRNYTICKQNYNNSPLLELMTCPIRWLIGILPSLFLMVDLDIAGVIPGVWMPNLCFTLTRGTVFGRFVGVLFVLTRWLSWRILFSVRLLLPCNTDACLSIFKTSWRFLSEPAVSNACGRFTGGNVPFAVFFATFGVRLVSSEWLAVAACFKASLRMIENLSLSVIRVPNRLKSKLISESRCAKLRNVTVKWDIQNKSNTWSIVLDVNNTRRELMAELPLERPGRLTRLIVFLQKLPITTTRWLYLSCLHFD